MATKIAVGQDRRELQPWRADETGPYLQAVMAAGQGGRVEPRLRPLAAAGSDEQGAYAGPHGGFLVPEAIAPTVVSAGPDVDPFMGRMTVIPMRFAMTHVAARVDTTHATSVAGGVRAYRLPETTPIETSRITMASITLTAHELVALTFASQRLLTDSGDAVRVALQTAVRDAIGDTLLEERIRGTGVGELGGVLRSPARIVVPKADGQVAGTILTTNLTQMVARCWRYARAVWIVTPDALEPLLELTSVVGTGGTLLPALTPNSDPTGPAFLLLGRPLYVSEAASALGDEGDVILVVPSEYLDGQYRPVVSASSMFVRFVALETAFRFVQRGGGMPWWLAPLTPKRSSQTRSPYVTLAARS